MTIKAVIHRISGYTTSTTLGEGVQLIGEGHYMVAPTGSPEPFGVGVDIGPLSSTLDDLVDAVIADALTKGYVISSHEILLPEVRRG